MHQSLCSSFCGWQHKIKAFSGSFSLYMRMPSLHANLLSMKTLFSSVSRNTFQKGKSLVAKFSFLSFFFLIMHLINPHFSKFCRWVHYYWQCNIQVFLRLYFIWGMLIKNVSFEIFHLSLNFIEMVLSKFSHNFVFWG